MATKAISKAEQAVLDAVDRSCKADDSAAAEHAVTITAMTTAFGTPGTAKADKAFKAFKAVHWQVSDDASINKLMEANKGKPFNELSDDAKQARRNRRASSLWSHAQPDSARSKAKGSKAKAKAKGGKVKTRPALAQLADSPAELQKALRAFAIRIQGQKESPYADQLGMVAALQVCADKSKPMTKSQRLGTKSRTK